MGDRGYHAHVLVGMPDRVPYDSLSPFSVFTAIPYCVHSVFSSSSPLSSLTFSTTSFPRGCLPANSSSATCWLRDDLVTLLIACASCKLRPLGIRVECRCKTILPPDTTFPRHNFDRRLCLLRHYT